jgi:hypothetical protein
MGDQAHAGADFASGSRRLTHHIKGVFAARIRDPRSDFVHSPENALSAGFYRLNEQPIARS